MSGTDRFSDDGCFITAPETFVCSVCGSDELVVAIKEGIAVLICLTCTNHQRVPVVERDGDK